MDFSFDSVTTKGKKKPFNFRKLDMDFSLDGEFDKISSFKMDMSDLDFSCSPKKPTKSKESKGDISDLDFTCSPEKRENKGDMPDFDFSCSPKKPAKSKENKAGECSGAKEGRGRSFDFNFDFNEMDSFNLDSSLLKGNRTSTTNLAKKGVTPHEIDSEVAKEPKTNDDEHGRASTDAIISKPQSSETVESSKVYTMEGNERDLDFMQDDSVPKVSSSGKLDMLGEARSSALRTEEKDQKREIPMSRNSESLSQEIDNPSSQTIDRNVSNQDNIPDQHIEVYSPGTKIITSSGGEQNVINNKAICVDPHGVKVPLENSSSLQIKKLESSDEEVNKFGSNTQAEATGEPHPVKNDSSFEKNTTEDVSKKISLDNDLKENQKSTLEDHLATTSSKPVVDEMMLVKDKKIKRMQSIFFSKSEDNVLLNQKSLATSTKGTFFGCKITGDMQLGSIIKARDNFKSNDAECGTRLVSDSTPPATKSVRDELTLLGGKDDVKILINAGKGIVSDDIQNGGKLTETKQPILKEVKKSKITLLDTDMSSKDVNILSSHVNPSCLNEKAARHANKIPANLHAQNSEKESFKNLRVTIDENKLSSIKAVKIGYKTPKGVKTDKGLSAHRHLKETNSPLNSEYMEMRGITAKIDHLLESAGNQNPAIPFLKRRKTNEVSEADLAPLTSLKRLRHCPSEISNSTECPEKVVEKVETKESRPNSLLCNTPTSELQCPSGINLMEVKLPASAFVEDNSNVEKAEAYTKELEDICNKLKKKHEEAKELIVRAVVNDNNLLMLNHPIYEEKIRKVQKLVMSKAIQT
ncbi:uncharacterized protein At4g18490 isoform X2 [Prosopis cineraria]|nr:uncharacterized protein At4g18490 isoform X2 [Prosopis cineraria]